MKLSALLSIFSLDVALEFDVHIQGLQNDSRHIASGDLFIAYPGAVTDGRDYIQQAIQAGAVAVLYDSDNFSLDSDSVNTIPLIPMPQLSPKLAMIAMHFYHHPACQLSVTGVTGTNGKTTIAYQLAQAYDVLGSPAAYIGTIGQGDVHALKPLANTTPDALCIQHLLYDYVADGVQQVCMEVSSHALSLGRVEGVEFQQAIYTNLSHEHLDFHGSMEAYAKAKASLFAIPTVQCAIINQDDAYSMLMQQHVPPTCRLLTYGIDNASDVRAVTWETGMSGSTINVVSPWGQHQLHTQSLGRFNLYNTLAVFTSLLASEIASVDAVVDVMSQLKPSPGRMEIVAQNPCVIVDYAHTPDALENVLLTLVDLKPQTLWVVFGCGGDRDRTKRPLMGRVASQYAHVVVLTNDNPRNEDPELIIQEIRQGMPADSHIHSIADRRAAIQYALNNANASDIILIAGKGHEDYQIIGAQRFTFSDQYVVREILS